MPTDRARLADDLLLDEAVRDRPYDDLTGKELRPGDTLRGKLTVGIGHNLTDRPLSNAVIAAIFEEDLSIAEAELYRAYPWIAALDPVRTNVLVNMSFNLGLPRFSQFVKMLAAVEAGQYATAAEEMLDSKWATDVGARADRLAEEMRSGSFTPVP